MKIKKGDTVKIMIGKDRGKTGKVLQSFPSLERVSVEGINTMVKNLRGKARGQGQKVEFPSPVPVANVILVCPRCGKTTRVNYQVSGEGKAKARACKKCNEVI